MIQDAEKVVIKVPASTANLGPGFDSLGLALSMYLSVEVKQSDHWEVVILDENAKDFPPDENHFICQIMKETAQRLHRVMPPCQLKIKNEIPLARGLGSSAAAITAGIEAANIICRLGLTQKEKLVLASDIEGHPDNAGASLMGGLVIGCRCNDSLEVINAPIPPFNVIAAVPCTELYTEEARKILPNVLAFDQAVKASAVANVMLAALLNGNWEAAGQMMQKDLFHQPYRSRLIPHFSSFQAEALRLGAFGAAISGSGPTVISFVEKHLSERVFYGLQAAFPDMEVLSLTIDYTGCHVLKGACVT